jgi:hypothetical protein
MPRVIAYLTAYSICVSLGTQMVSAQQSGQVPTPVQAAKLEQPQELADSVARTTSLSSEATTISEILLAQSTAEGRSDESPSDVNSPETDDADTDETMDEDRDTNNETAQRNQRRIDLLRRPLRLIRIVAATDAPVPNSVADEVLGQSDDVLISSSGQTVPQPSRYTTSFCHRPLYFEELNLERCGNTYGCATNAVSGFHFLTNTAMLPYRLATQRPDCTEPTRGDCQTCQEYSHDIEPFGFEPRGVLVEAAAAAGFVFLMM